MAILTVAGAFDMHIHTAPAPFVRIGDSAEVARWCAEAGMGGIVVKSHFESTVSKVHHARQAVTGFPDFKVFAGIALNRGVGGVNPGAVDLALQQGAKVVWLPTLDSENHARVFGSAGTYGFAAMTVSSRRRAKGTLYTVLGPDGKLTPDTKEVIELVKDYGAVLATGHLSKEEILAVVDHAKAVGATKLVVTHPELATPKLDLPTMVELAKAGVLMEFCLVNILPVFYSVSLRGLAEMIAAVTPECAVISTDGGQPFNPRPHEVLRMGLQSLHEVGVTEAAIRTMSITNPRKLLGLDA